MFFFTFLLLVNFCVKKSPLSNKFIVSFADYERSFESEPEHLLCGVQIENLSKVLLLLMVPLSTIFQLYRGVSFIGGGNWRTRGKPSICRK